LWVGLVWLVIVGAAAVAYRVFIYNPHKEEIVRRGGSDPRHKQRVTLALDSFSGYSIFRSAEFAEELSQRGIGLDLHDDEADYAARIRSVKSGQTPLAVFTIDALIKASADLDDLPGTIVMVIDETTGADAMVAYKQAVATIDALNRAEARIVVTRDSPSEALARVVKFNFNLPQLPEDCWIDADGAADVFQKFRQANPREPRAYVLWEPYVSMALAQPGAHVVIDSSRFRGYIVDVLVAQREFLTQNEPLVRSFVEAYLSARHELARKDQMVELVSADAQELGEKLTTAQAERLVEGIWWKNTQENYAHFGLLSPSEAQGLQHLDEMIRGINKVLVATKAIASDPTEGQPHLLYYDKILKQLQPDFHPGLGAKEEITSVEQGPISDAQWQQLRPVGTAQVDPIAFQRGRAVLLDESTSALDDLAGKLKSFPHYYLMVTGRARASGDPEQDKINRDLASQRAQAAVDYLKRASVPEHRVRVVGAELEEGGEAQSVGFVLGQLPY
jgi:outer membrane protein OmpA-like peptidoglycan-associated protein